MPLVTGAGPRAARPITSAGTEPAQRERPGPEYGSFLLVEPRGLEPLTPTLPARRRSVRVAPLPSATAVRPRHLLDDADDPGNGPDDSAELRLPPRGTRPDAVGL